MIVRDRKERCIVPPVWVRPAFLAGVIHRLAASGELLGLGFAGRLVARTMILTTELLRTRIRVLRRRRPP